MIEIFTLIITLLLGIPGIIIFFQQRRTKLFFIKEKEVNLQEDLLKNFENLLITYDGVEIGEKITYLKGHVVCTGNKDLSENNNQLKIYSADVSFLNFKITNTSEGLDLNSAIVDNKAVINFNLLKNGEFFSFETIIKREGATTTKEVKLSFHHRIPNLPAIEQQSSSTIRDTKRVILFGAIYFGMGLFALIFCSTIQSYDVETYDAKTGQVLETKDFYYTKEFDKVIDKVNNDYWGLELFVIKTRPYKFIVEDSTFKKVQLNAKFRRNDYHLLIFCIFGIIALLFGLLHFLVFLSLLKYHDPLKYINATANARIK